MPSAGTISVTLDALTSDFNDEMKKSTEKMQSWSGMTQTVALASAAAFAGMAGAIGVSLKKFSEGEDAIVRLQAAFAASGQALDVDRAVAFAGQLQNLTNVADDVTHSVQGMLATFGFTQDQTETLLPRVVDLSKAMGVDLNAAAKMVGKSIESGLVTMDDYGIKLSKTEAASFAAMNQTQRLAEITEILDQRFGGVAETLAGTLSGRLQRVTNDFGDLLEEFGKLINMTGVGDALLKISDGLQDAIIFISRLTPEAKEMIGQVAVAVTVFTGLTTALAAVSAVLPSLAAGLGILKTAMAGVAIPAAALLASMMAIVTAAGALKRFKSKFENLASGKLTPGSTTYDPALAEKYNLGIGEELKQSFTTGLTSILTPIKDSFQDLMRSMVDQNAEVEKKTKQVSRPRKGKAAEAMDFGFTGEKVDLAYTLGEVATGFAAGLSSAVSEYKETLALDADKVLRDKFAMVERVADEVAFDLEHSFLDAGSSLIDGATKGTTALGEAFNFLADTIGPELAHKTLDFAQSILPSEDTVSAASDFAGQAIDTTMSAISNSAGQLLSAVTRGGGSGGIAGAIGAGVGYLLTQTKAFSETMAVLSDMMVVLVDIVEPLMESLKPLVVLLAEMVVIVMNQLAPVFELLTPVLEGLFHVIRGVALFITKIVQAVGGFWNGIVSAIARVFDKLADISVFGYNPLGFMHGWANSIEKGKINMNGLNRAIETLEDTTLDSAKNAGKGSALDENSISGIVDNAQSDFSDSLDGNSSALDDNSEKIKSVSASLANLPQGFKIASERFNATLADTAESASMKAFGTPDSNGGGVVIEALNITASDPQELWSKLKSIMQREAVVSTGSSVASSLGYSTAAA